MPEKASPSLAGRQSGKAQLQRRSEGRAADSLTDGILQTRETAMYDWDGIEDDDSIDAAEIRRDELYQRRAQRACRYPDPTCGCRICDPDEQ